MLSDRASSSEDGDLGFTYLAVKSGSAQAGWEVDRTGHSLGRNRPLGQSVNLDDWETHDTRRLLPGLAVTVEPGVCPGPFGIRSEVNVLITETDGVVTTPIQTEPYRLVDQGRIT